MSKTVAEEVMEVGTLAAPKPRICHKICETCPWLTKNHGKPHPAGWYKIANIKRIWNGLRTGKAPGVVCHASDKDQAEYGGTAKVKLTVEKRPCAGAVLAVGKHIEEINACKTKDDLAAYKARHKLPLTKFGIAAWWELTVFGQVPDVEDRRGEVSLPWDDKP